MSSVPSTRWSHLTMGLLGHCPFLRKIIPALFDINVGFERFVVSVVFLLYF
jgi:hypothetical protein